MNALMVIDVRVRSAAALAQLRGLEVASNKAAGGVGAVGSRASWGLPIISKWGNQIQWAGRQLMYNFTIPLGIAAAAGTKWALDNEKAMVRVAKVYGDNSKVFQKLSKTELPALGKAFEALSNEFGVARSEVINIAADWAAAGASGVALAKSVDLTLQTMILGELDAASATKQLIAIQAQYGFTVKQLAHTIDILNMVENQTGATMADLMDGMSRAAGVARVAGVDVEHLSAMMSALVPATGSAATAGNALKTIISRLIAPTQDAVDILGEIGINVSDVGWQSLSAADRIELLAKRYDGLSNAAKANIASVIGSRWQFNRLVVLLEDVNRQHGYYQKSLQATSDQEKLLAQKQKELNQVLQSNPQRLKQAWVILQNALANVIMPLLPALVELARKAGELGHWFQNLSVTTQKWVLAGLILLALVGPLTRYIGALLNLVGLLSGAFHLMIGIWPKLIGGIALFTGWVFALAAAPFKLIWAGLVGIGSAGAAMGGMFLRGMAIFFAPLVASFKLWMTTFRAVVIAGMATVRLAMIEGFALVIAPLRVIGFATSTAFAMGMATGGTLITRVWGGILMALTFLWGTFMTTMRAMYVAFLGMTGAMMIGFRTILLGGARVAMLGMAFMLRAGLTSLITGIVRLMPLLLRALTGPWGLAITAIFLLLVAFKDKVASALHGIAGAFSNFIAWINSNFKSLGNFFGKISDGIVNAFWALPEGVRNAMLAVINVVATAAKQVYEWMSYLNPFARHSPSLVDQVVAGNAAIRNEYARTATSVARQKAIITKADIGAQEKVVARWKAALDQANDSLDVQQSILDRLKDKLSALTDAYDAHKQAAQDFASAPLQGMQAMSDAIFQNQMAQKKLQLQMAQWEQVNGSLDDAANKLSNIAGELEQLKGEASSLRLAGAGSDVLGPIQAQVDSLQQAADQLRQTTQNSPMADMQKQLDALQKQGDILDLQQSINFDPLTRQLDQLANAQKEISFDDAVAGIKREQASMAALQPQIDTLTAAVNKQEAAVQKAKDARDQIADRYDKERAKLAALKKAYTDLHGAMSLAKGNGPGGAAGFAISSFDAAKAGNFPTVGGDAKIGREGSLKDQSKLIDQFTKETTDKMGSIWGGFDMFKPIKEKWKAAWAWMKQNLGPVATDIGTGIQQAFAGMGDVFGNKKFKSGAENAFSSVWNAIKPVIDKIVAVVQLVAPDFKRMFDAIVKAGKRLWTEVGPNLVGLLKDLWPLVKIIAAVLGVVLVAALKLVTSIIGHVFAPILDTIITVLNGVITFVRGAVNIIVGIFTLDLGKIVEGVGQIFSGLWTVIWGILKGLWNLIGGIIQGIVGGIVGFFKWLYDVLVGHSIIPDLIDGIIFYFKLLIGIVKWIWNNVLHPIFSLFKSIWNDFIEPFLGKIFSFWKSVWNNLLGIAKWLYDNVLSPIFSKIKSIWTNIIQPFLGTIFGLWKTAWNGLTTLGTWVYNNVMQPVIDKIKAGWNAIKQWLIDNKDMLLKPVKGIVNVVIKAVNALISGLNLVSKALPGISFHIAAIPEFAQGGPLPGRRVGNGFMTNGARAIVGEGKANYPEYVIPTDPTYRQRAAALLASAAQRMNLGISIDPARQGILGDTAKDMRLALQGGSQNAKNAVPMFEIGGLIPGPIKDAANGIKKIGSWAKGNLRELATAPMKPYFALARKLVGTVDWPPAKGLGLSGIDSVQSWVDGVDRIYGKKAEALHAASGGSTGAAWSGTYSSDERLARAQRWVRTQVGKPYIWGGVGPDGYDCSGLMSAITNVIRGQSPHSRVGVTGNFPWGGFIAGADPSGFTIGSTRSYAGGVGHMAGTLAGMNVESAGGVGVRIGAAARGYGDSGFSTRAHIAGLREGAIIRARMGGTIFRGGEGTNDEALVPLPTDWKNAIRSNVSDDSKTVVIHIHGNLEFPNIDNADDVQKFIKNLEILAKD